MSVFVTQQPLPYFVGGGRYRPGGDGPVVGSVSYQAFSAASPSTVGTVDTGVTLGVEFYVTSAANLTEIRWWQPTTTSDGTARQAALYTVAGSQVVAPVTGSAPAAPGWQTISVTPFALTPTARYRAVVYHPNGGYPVDGAYFAGLADVVSGVLTVPGAPNATANKQGVFEYGVALAFPDTAFNDSNYWTDVTVAT